MATKIIQRSLEADDTAGPKIEINTSLPLVDDIPQDADDKLFRELAFLNQLVEIVLQPLEASMGEPSVPISVDGDRISLTPGIPITVRRYHLDRLIRARPDSVTRDGGEISMPESQRNLVYRQSFSRYNFDIIKDTPAGLDWARELRRKYTRR